MFLGRIVHNNYELSGRIANVLNLQQNSLFTFILSSLCSKTVLPLCTITFLRCTFTSYQTMEDTTMLSIKCKTSKLKKTYINRRRKKKNYVIFQIKWKVQSGFYNRIKTSPTGKSFHRLQFWRTELHFFPFGYCFANNLSPICMFTVVRISVPVQKKSAIYTNM